MNTSNWYGKGCKSTVTTTSEIPANDKEARKLQALNRRQQAPALDDQHAAIQMERY